MYSELFKIKYSENIFIYLNKYTNKVVFVHFNDTIIYTNDLKINEVLLDRDNY